MIRILKLITTLLFTSAFLCVATWFFLRSSIIENFTAESGEMLHEISIMTDPISGQSKMEKYLARSGKLIYRHLTLPFFPLIRQDQQKEMEKVVLERVVNFKKKLERMDGSATGSRVNVYHSVLGTYKELFPGNEIPFNEKLDITIRAIKESEKKGESVLEKAKEISKTAKPPEDPEKAPKSGKREQQRDRITRPETRISAKITPDKVKTRDENRTIPLSKVGDHMGERVYVYLKTGRKLEGFIKSLSPGFLHLDIEFKGGIFSAKIIRSDIEEIIKVKENIIFKYLREEGSGR